MDKYPSQPYLYRMAKNARGLSWLSRWTPPPPCGILVPGRRPPHGIQPTVLAGVGPASGPLGAGHRPPQGLVPPPLPGDGLPLGLRLSGKHRLHGWGGVDVWVGTAQPPELDGLLWVVDLPKGDVEVKLLYGCTPKSGSWPSSSKTGRPICWPSWPCVLWRLWKNHSTENVFLHCARAGKFPRRPACFFCPRNFIIVLNWNNKQRKVEYYGGKIGQGPAPACYQSM